MDLFERIDNLLIIEGESRNSLAKKIDTPQSTFNGYFNKERQEKLTPHLWAILGLFPAVQRDWLFFGEGEMLKSGELNKEIELSKQEPVAPLILAEQLVQSAPDEVVTLRAEVAALTKDLITTQKDLIAAKDRIIELQRNQRPGNSLIPIAE